MATNNQRKPAHPPSPLQPYVDAGAPPEIMLEGHKVQQRPALLRGVAALVAAFGTTMGVAAVIYDQHMKRTASPVVPAQQVVQAEAMQQSLPAPQKSP